MIHDWLLVETLGREPAVVAQGPRTKNLVPVSAFLRRNPHLMAIQTAIGETVRAGKGLSSITPKNDRVIRTAVVQMSDGRIHGVHVWIGPPDVDPPERPIPGPLKWDLTSGVGTDSAESLFNLGKDPSAEATHGRAFADDLPARDLNPSEEKVLAMAMRPEAGMTFCSTWDMTDHRGEPIAVGFAGRVLLESQDDGSERLVGRAMNWRSIRENPEVPADYLSQLILNGLAKTGVHRALVDPATWKLLKWLDDPAPFYDWRARERGEPSVHPADARHMARMTTEFTDGMTSGVLRMPNGDGGWTPVHMSVSRVELDQDTVVGLLSLKVPTDDELTAADLDEADDAPVKQRRKSKSRKGKPDEAES